jgi:hypothetical protein
MVKSKVLFYDVQNENSNENVFKSYTDTLFDKTGKQVGSLQVNKFQQNSENIPIFATIVLSKVTINYNYVRSGKEKIVAKSSFSSNNKKFIIKREYLNETKRKLTIIYDF